MSEHTYNPSTEAGWSLTQYQFGVTEKDPFSKRHFETFSQQTYCSDWAELHHLNIIKEQWKAEATTQNQHPYRAEEKIWENKEENNIFY